MTSKVGRRQYVEQDESTSLKVRLLDDQSGSEITLAGTNTVAIYDTSGNVLVSAVAVTSTSGAEATYTRTWDDATFNRLRGYKARWALSDGTTTYNRTTFFEVIRRLFRSQLNDSELTGKHPYIANRLPAGATDFSSFRMSAWEDITTWLEKRIPEIRTGYLRRSPKNYDAKHLSSWLYAESSYPGNLFNPEDFYRTHELLTLSEFYGAVSFDASALSEDESKSEKYRIRALEAFDVACQKIAFDWDDDGIMADDEREADLSSIRIRR